jgi:hypothetical protein
MFQTKVVEKIRTHLSFQYIYNFFFKLCPVYEIMWKNIVQLGRPQKKIWCMCITCWRPTAMSTVSEYVTLKVFPLQQWLQKCASALHYTYTACLVAIKVDSLILTLAYYPLQYSSPC